MRRRLWFPTLFFAISALAHIVLWLPLPLPARGVAVLLITALLPGLLATALLLGPAGAMTPGAWILSGLGTGYAVLATGMLLLSYLPGGLSWWAPLGIFDALSLGLLLLYWRQESVAVGYATGVTYRVTSSAVRPTIALAVLIFLVLGGYFRLTHLGYSEFLTDEARVVSRASAMIEGAEDVLFLHRKGPVEILLPAAIYAVTGQIDEATARLPFALASLAGLGAVFLLGTRLFKEIVSPPAAVIAGWSAAFFLVFDGYLIGFSRFVQYQSIVFFVSALVVLLLCDVLQTPLARSRRFILAALLAATGVLSHYDGLLVTIPALVILVALGLLRTLLPGIVTGLSVTALFYVPFLLHRNFQATYAYLIGQRLAVDRSFPYNNLVDIAQRSAVYNASYYLVAGVVLVMAALVLAYLRGWGRRWGMLLGALACLLVLVTLWHPQWFTVSSRNSGRDLLVAPFALALFLVWVAPRLDFAWRMLWIWFGALFLLMVFVVGAPRTHVYVFHTPWALLAGGVVAYGVQRLRKQRWLQAPFRGSLLGGMAAGAAAIVFGLYAHGYFVQNEVEALRQWEEYHLAGYWTPFGRPTTDGLYGFPLANGWKVVGALYAQGILEGDYDTNQRDDLIPGWYTRQQYRCGATAVWYFAVDTLEYWSTHRQPGDEALRDLGYARWGVVEVNGAPRMTIYRQHEAEAPAESPVQTLRLDDFTAQFDALTASAPAPAYPVIEPEIAHLLHANLDNQVWLEGYDLTFQEPLMPGDTFHLVLYWRAQREGLPSYKVFNQSFYGEGVMVAQQDGVPVCGRRSTNTWYPGELIEDSYKIPIALDAPAGVYPLYVGMYSEEDFVRLPVLDAAGNQTDDKIHIADLEIRN